MAALEKDEARCPGCGANIKTNVHRCPLCHKKINDGCFLMLLKGIALLLLLIIALWFTIMGLRL
jgi:hypothetical protein